MVEIGATTSRRALLGALAAAPIAAVSRWDAAIAALPYAATQEPLMLWRSKEGRSLSRVRYHRAESFFVGIEAGTPHHRHDQLYQIGIVLQLGLSSHLLDVGFDDAWCARNLGLHIAKSLAYANATGLGHDPRSWSASRRSFLLMGSGGTPTAGILPLSAHFRAAKSAG